MGNKGLYLQVLFLFQLGCDPDFKIQAIFLRQLLLLSRFVFCVNSKALYFASWFDKVCINLQPVVYDILYALNVWQFVEFTCEFRRI